VAIRYFEGQENTLAKKSWRQKRQCRAYNGAMIARAEMRCASVRAVDRIYGVARLHRNAWT